MSVQGAFVPGSLFRRGTMEITPSPGNFPDRKVLGEDSASPPNELKLKNVGSDILHDDLILPIADGFSNAACGDKVAEALPHATERRAVARSEVAD